MSDYRQHSPGKLKKDNIPGKALRAMLYSADRLGVRPTYGDLQHISRIRGYEFNNGSAAVSQLRQILEEAMLGTVVCSDDKPGKLHFQIWDHIEFGRLLNSLGLPFDMRLCIFDCDPNLKGEFFREKEAKAVRERMANAGVGE